MVMLSFSLNASLRGRCNSYGWVTSQAPFVPVGAYRAAASQGMVFRWVAEDNSHIFPTVDSSHLLVVLPHHGAYKSWWVLVVCGVYSTADAIAVTPPPAPGEASWALAGVTLAAEQTRAVATKSPEVAGQGSQAEAALEPSGRSQVTTGGGGGGTKSYPVCKIKSGSDSSRALEIPAPR